MGVCCCCAQHACWAMACASQVRSGLTGVAAQLAARCISGSCLPQGMGSAIIASGISQATGTLSPWFLETCCIPLWVVLLQLLISAGQGSCCSGSHIMA